MTDDDLERSLSVYAATSIGIGTMIGGGIFILPSVAVEQAGPASLIAFAICGFISLLSAISHAELATFQQAAGGTYRYAYKGLGSFLGTITGFSLLIGLIFEITFYTFGFAQYLTFFGDLFLPGAAAILLILLVALNYHGAADAGILEDGIVAGLLLLMMAFVLKGVPAVEFGQFTPFNPEGWSAVFRTAGTVYVGFIGFSLVATVSEEVKNPSRSIPLAMIASVLIPTVLYLGTLAVTIGVLPLDQIASSNIPVADAGREVAGWIGGLAVTLGAIFATVASANASIFSAGRVSLAMARDKVITPWFDKVHSSYSTPHRGLLFSGLAVLTLIAVGFGIDMLAQIASFLYLVTYGMGHLAVINFRRKDIDYDPHFRIPDKFHLYPLIPVAGILTTLWIMSQMNPLVIAGGTGVVVLASLWYKHQH